jgi:hypothetical protein
VDGALVWSVLDQEGDVHLSVADYSSSRAASVARTTAQLMNRAYEAGRQDAHAQLRKVLDL